MTTGHGNILIVGPSGAGKSTLARALAERLGLRAIELDALAWNPGWALAPDEELRARIAAATDEDGWVADGNYTRLRDITWARASTAVWLDLPLRTLLPRIVRRSWRRWRQNEVLWGTNQETFWEHFLPNDRSLIWFTVRTHRRRRRDLAAAMRSDEWPRLRWVRLRSPRDVERWLALLPSAHEES